MKDEAVYIYCGSEDFCTAAEHPWLCLLLLETPEWVPSTSTTISTQAPYSVIMFSRLFIPEQTWSWSHKFPYIKAGEFNRFLIWVPAQVWHWKSFLFEEKSGSPLKCPGHSFGVSQQTCLSSTEGWRHKSNVRGLREWLLGIYESIRLHFFAQGKRIIISPCTQLLAFLCFIKLNLLKL